MTASKLADYRALVCQDAPALSMSYREQGRLIEFDRDMTFFLRTLERHINDPTFKPGWRHPLFDIHTRISLSAMFWPLLEGVEPIYVDTGGDMENYTQVCALINELNLILLGHTDEDIPTAIRDRHAQIAYLSNLRPENLPHAPNTDYATVLAALGVGPRAIPLSYFQDGRFERVVHASDAVLQVQTIRFSPVAMGWVDRKADDDAVAQLAQVLACNWLNLGSDGQLVSLGHITPERRAQMLYYLIQQVTFGEFDNPLAKITWQQVHESWIEEAIEILHYTQRWLDNHRLAGGPTYPSLPGTPPSLLPEPWITSPLNNEVTRAICTAAVTFPVKAKSSARH